MKETEAELRVPRRQKVLAVAAAVAMVPGLGVGLSTLLAAHFIMTALPALYPLCLLRRQDSFVRACLVIGSGMLAWSLAGFLLGMFLFIPTAVLLLVAAFADRSARLGLRDKAVPGALLVAGAMFVPLLTYDAGEPEPDSYQAELDSGSRVHHQDFAAWRNQLLKSGATHVIEYESCEHFYLDVGFAEDLPDDRRAELVNRIMEVPGVVEVELGQDEGC
ncbi:hypothetical protein [Streptomyces sp. NPDC005494]|jgi:hypothetical protein|uniref:hypothetical protein n=2 Tax=Streptomyces TaxID=1883 RepID=UPI00369A58FC